MDENIVEREVRLRLLEDCIQNMNSQLLNIQQKIDNQFNLIVGAIITSCLAVVLHVSKLM